MRTYYVILILLSLFIVGCEQPEGVGGVASIDGTVTVNVYDKQHKVLQESYPASDKDVFIIYGNDEYDFTETKTNFDGKFRFDYLAEGDYTIYVLSEQANTLSDSTIEVNITIGDKDASVTTPDFNIIKTIDYNDGFGTISGNVFLLKGSNGIVTDTVSAVEKEVYLYFEDNQSYIERIRTGENGWFQFPGLLKGLYTVVVFGDNPIAGKADITYNKTIELESIDDNGTINSFYIYKD